MSQDKEKVLLNEMEVKILHLFIEEGIIYDGEIAEKLMKLVKKLRLD